QTPGNILVFIIDKLKLQLTRHSWSIHNGPTDKALGTITMGTIAQHIATGTIVVSKKPGTPFKTRGIGIVKKYRFEFSLPPFIGNTVQDPVTAQYTSILSCRLGNGTGGNKTCYQQ